MAEYLRVYGVVLLALYALWLLRKRAVVTPRDVGVSPIRHDTGWRLREMEGSDDS